MFSSHWPVQVLLAVKATTLLAGAAAAAISWYAAHLWLKASKVEIRDTTPRAEVSAEDNPGLANLEVKVAAYAIQEAYSTSADLNADAAPLDGLGGDHRWRDDYTGKPLAVSPSRKPPVCDPHPWGSTPTFAREADVPRSRDEPRAAPAHRFRAKGALSHIRG